MLRIAVVGAGAIGSLLGARLALAGQDVTVVARGANLQAIRSAGLRLVEHDGSEHLATGVKAVQRLSDAGAQDALLLTVKAHQVRDLLPDLARALVTPTMLVTMVNGIPWWYFQRLAGPWQGRVLQSVDPGGELAAAIDPAAIIGSVVYPAAQRVGPGCVRVVEGNRFSLGELDGSRSERIETLAGALTAAGFKAPVSRDIRSEIWLKLWGNLSFNPISALTQATLADICAFAPTRELAAAMMTEAGRVAEALGARIRLGVEQRIAGAEAVGAHRTSMLQDLQAGRALELQALLGSVAELARLTQTATPAIDAVLALASLLARTVQGARLAPT